MADLATQLYSIPDIAINTKTRNLNIYFMNDSNHYVDLVSGTEVMMLRIKDLLEEEEIPSIIQNDLQSGNLGGFFGGTPTTVRLKVRNQDFNKAKAVIENPEIS